MNAKIKVLKVLLSSRNETFTIRAIAKQAKLNYRIAYDVVMELEKGRLITTQKIGNTRICTLTNRFDWQVFRAEYERRESLFKNKDFLVLYQRLAELKFPFIALLFGSHAKGKANKHSDIDLLTIGGDKQELQRLVSLWPEQVHLTTITYDDFIRMAKSREFTVVSEAIQNNIILVGIEEYYRLLSNVE